MSYQVQLKPRLEDIQKYSVPKKCSSCFRRTGSHHRILTTLLDMGRRTKVQWTIQLPLCETCYEMYQVLYNYLPSRFGPPDRRQGNRRASLALTLLFLVAIANLALPQSLVPWLTELNKFLILLGLGVIFIGLYYWNSRANQRARMELYQQLVEKAGHEFGNAEIHNLESPRGFITKKVEKQGPILIFDNEAFGQAFEKSNPDLLSTNTPDSAE